ncbi:SAM-dependent methyltransferase [Rheinheimera pleomorphica]|uniref:SAM-dependent methyltransferase n=1 Tax=Rheinheimera pleomorphica TaxID=2703963 RepID=UPI0019D5485E|nr:SAM-dependent methyltransferase [Rheinheimera pleomorphica]
MQGSLVCIGTGITLGSHISPLSRSYIEQADVVFVLVADGITEKWIEQMNADVRSLQPYYLEGKSRMITYREMVAAMLAEVTAGKNVVGAFYGHPGVFAWVPHNAIKQARELGYNAHMEPGISAEDCLYADLGIDPGTYGCQHYETSQFMFYKRTIDTAAYLVLWQVLAAGDKSLARFSACRQYLEVLVELLSNWYSHDHSVFLYEAKTLPVQSPRIVELKLSELPAAQLDMKTTLVIPPAKKLEKNEELLSKLELFLVDDDANTD